MSMNNDDFVPNQGYNDGYPQQQCRQYGGNHELDLELLVYPHGDGEHDHRGHKLVSTGESGPYHGVAAGTG